VWKCVDCTAGWVWFLFLFQVNRKAVTAPQKVLILVHTSNKNDDSLNL
jgi:hypothetical protein